MRRSSRCLRRSSGRRRSWRRCLRRPSRLRRTCRRRCPLRRRLRLRERRHRRIPRIPPNPRKRRRPIVPRIVFRIPRVVHRRRRVHGRLHVGRDVGHGDGAGLHLHGVGLHLHSVRGRRHRHSGRLHRHPAVHRVGMHVRGRRWGFGGGRRDLDGGRRLRCVRVGLCTSVRRFGAHTLRDTAQDHVVLTDHGDVCDGL